MPTPPTPPSSPHRCSRPPWPPPFSASPSGCGWACRGSAGFRGFLADYPVTVVVVAVSALSFVRRAHVPCPSLGWCSTSTWPAHFGPTCHFEQHTAPNTNATAIGSGGGNSSEATPACTNDLDNTSLPARPWLSELWSADTPTLLPVNAAGCALLISCFFYFDQNASLCVRTRVCVRACGAFCFRFNGSD
jgi:hypothetical protein